MIPSQRTVTISHHRLNVGTPITEVRRVMFQKPIQVNIGCIMFDINNNVSYSGVDLNTFTAYTFDQEDIVSQCKLVQLDDTADHVRRLLGLVSNISHGQQVLTSRIAELTLEYNHIQAENARLAAIVSDLAQGQQRIIDTLSTIAQRTATPAQAAAPARKSIFPFFSSTQTKGK